MIQRLATAALFFIFTIAMPINICLADKSAKVLRILSYNIKHGEGMDRKVDLKRAAKLIKKLNPDLVALQEIDNKTKRTKNVDQAAQLGKLTGMHHAFGSFLDYQGGEYGMAILSKQKFMDVKNHQLPRGAEPRSSLVVSVKPIKDGPELVLANVHFYATQKQRLAQATALLKILKDETRPVLIVGDFNSKPKSAVMNLFSKDWSIPDKGKDHFTFPSDRPRVEIDFIMFRPKTAFTVKKIDVLHEPLVSDHRPVLLELTIPQRKPQK